MAGMTINSWQYGRWVYLIGRTVKMRPFTSDERVAIIAFITAIIPFRESLLPRINLKYDNSFSYELSKQNDHALGKMLQMIGRNFKSLFPVVGEKTLCDTLFENTDKRRYLTYKDFVDTAAEEDLTDEETGEEQVG